ncbi:hypothetical protein ABZ379_45395 [Streptomyces canus]|uniref:hypothetical protein n=1 Tax=Streptomyces canus TaxID=58343 RepID=UPI0033C177D3
MEMNPTALLLELTAHARSMSEPDTLREALTRGHHAWCEGLAEVQAGVARETVNLTDAELAERAAAAGTPWGEGMTRGEAVAALAFATWDSTPAAMAYTELAERAALHGVTLLSEEVQ